MSWTKKSAAPDYANLAETVEALITGTPDGWALPWWSLVDNRVVDINAFCALGPETCGSLDINDFLIGLGAGEFAPAVILLGLREKITCWARQRLFSAYCENIPGATTGWCPYVDVSWPITGDQTWAINGTKPNVYTWVDVVPGELLRITMSGSQQPDMYWSAATGSDIIVGGPWNSVAQTYTVPTGKTRWGAAFRWSGTNYTGHLTIERQCSIPETYDAPDLVEPPGLVAPTPKTYTDIADLGAELDKLEQKLHWVLDYAAAAASDRFIPLAPDGSTVEPENDEDVELTALDLGVIVYAAPVTYETSLEFGDPPKLFHYGRILMGNGSGWLAPIDLTVQPMIVLKPDPTMNVVRVHARDGVTITLQKLVKPPPSPPA